MVPLLVSGLGLRAQGKQMKRLVIFKRLAVVAMTMGCCACGVTGPVTVLRDNGQILRGSFSATFSGGTFSVTDGQVTCSGTYDSWDMSSTISMAVKCSDGRTGTATAKRDASLKSGTGTVLMDDGTRATMVFGFGAYTAP